jgi:hypothetical protein
MAVFEKKMQWHGINAPELMVFWKQPNVEYLSYSLIQEY